MLGFKTEGVVLKRSNYGEADRILTVFTASSGKVTILAKGVRRITSRRAGNVELLNRVSMYLHKGKNFLILTEATSLTTFQNIKSDLTLSTYAYHIIELVNKLTAEGQIDYILYRNLVESLNILEKTPRQIFVRAFETKLLSHLGFFSFTENVNQKMSGIDAEILKILAFIETSSWEEIKALELDSTQAMELERVLRYHIESVIEGKLKSRTFLKKT